MKRIAIIFIILIFAISCWAQCGFLAISSVLDASMRPSSVATVPDLLHNIHVDFVNSGKLFTSA